MTSAHSLEFSPRARAALKRIDATQRLRILRAIDLLADNPRPPKAKNLVGHQGWFRVRVGDYRIVYAVNDGELIVLVITIGHRRDVYRAL